MTNIIVIFIISMTNKVVNIWWNFMPVGAMPSNPRSIKDGKSLFVKKVEWRFFDSALLRSE